jgi:hypothetical protein
MEEITFSEKIKFNRGSTIFPSENQKGLTPQYKTFYKLWELLDSNQ